MITITGKYNTACVMLKDESELEEKTKEQISNFLDNPAFGDTHIAIMPDCHAGAGAVIGFTMKMNKYVIPNVVGVDIGCGIVAVRLDGVDKIDFTDLDKAIHRIPSGFSKYPNDKSGDDKPYNRNISALEDIVNTSQVMRLTGTIGCKYDDVICSLGTLGGGNHFIEINQDNEGNYWAVIHSGSRNFGLRIANYFQGKAKELLKDLFIDEAYKNLEFLPLERGGYEYLEAMSLAQKYAKLNRRLMLEQIVERYFGLHIKELPVVESVHNYIDLDNKIIRKGAIAAYEGDEVIIPLNMRDGSIIGIGKSNKQWNNSAPHGAGRILSRTKAKESVSLTDYEKSMEGIYTSCINKNTLDEAPMVYKDKDMIIDAIKDAVDIKFIMKPVYNFKACGD